MKKLALLIAAYFIASAAPAFADHVNGYYRGNGTYVQPYERTHADGNPDNNYSSPGQYNPNTGRYSR